MLSKAPVAGTIPAEDIERAIEFYRETLGLEITRTSPGSAFIHAGKDSRLYAYQRERTRAEHTAAHFFVDDLDAVVNTLIKRGITFERYSEENTDERGVFTSEDGERAAWLLDSEGNILGLVQRSNRFR